MLVKSKPSQRPQDHPKGSIQTYIIYAAGNLSTSAASQDQSIPPPDLDDHLLKVLGDMEPFIDNFPVSKWNTNNTLSPKIHREKQHFISLTRTDT